MFDKQSLDSLFEELRDEFELEPEWEEIVKNLNTSNESIFNLKKKLKIFVEESDEQKKRFKLLRNEILNHQEKGNLISKNLYETENKINNLKNRQDLIKNKKIEIKRFLETIVNDKNNELKVYLS